MNSRPWIIHVRVDWTHALCGTRNPRHTVEPRQAKHVTCKRCLAKLAKFGQT